MWIRRVSGAGATGPRTGSRSVARAATDMCAAPSATAFTASRRRSSCTPCGGVRQPGCQALVTQFRTSEFLPSNKMPLPRPIPAFRDRPSLSRSRAGWRQMSLLSPSRGSAARVSGPGWQTLWNLPWRKAPTRVGTSLVSRASTGILSVRIWYAQVDMAEFLIPQSTSTRKSRDAMTEVSG